MKRNVLLVLAAVAVVAVISAGTYRGAQSADSAGYEILRPVMMPAPDETIKYDDNTLSPINFMDNNSRYWDVRFTPDSTCSLIAAIIAIDTNMAAPICTLFVWDDNLGNPQGAVVKTWQVFTPADYLPLVPPGVWTLVTLASPYVDSNAFHVGYFLQNPGIGFPPEVDHPMCDKTAPTPPFRSLVNTSRAPTGWAPIVGSYAGFYDLGLMAVVRYFKPTIRDVQPTAVLSPGDTVHCDTSYAVQASVKNNGNTTETFNVSCTIDTFAGAFLFYNQTKTVTSLAPSGTQTVTFNPPPWTLPELDSLKYRITVITQLATDMTKTNDTLRDTTFSYCYWFDDVGAVSLLLPGDSVYCDSTVTVRARAHNYSNRIRSFDFRVLIDSMGTVIYNQTTTVANLNPGTNADTTFPAWHVPTKDGMKYKIRLATTLASDMNPANDTARDSTYGRCVVMRDVGTVAIVVPGDTVFCDSTYYPQAQVKNFGDVTESFAVRLLIDTSGVNLYADTFVVAGLMSDSTAIADFVKSWTVPQLDGKKYRMTANTIFGSDMNSLNDTKVDTTNGKCLWIRDVTPTSIVWPGDTVTCDFADNVAAKVTNYGQTTETFAVEAVIESMGTVVWIDTTAVVGLIPPETTDAIFSQWTVPHNDGVTYDVRIRTLLGPDVIQGNDTLFGSSYDLCMLHDVGVASVDSPPDSVIVGLSYAPCATVHNFGDLAETFDVVCRIGAGYEDTASVIGLDPTMDMQVCFDDWLVPSAGGWDVCVTTYLVNDANVTNDSLCKSIEAYIGAEEMRTLAAVPGATRILQNRPNPFSRQTTVEYGIAAEGKVNLSIYDATGRLVKVLVEESKSPGYFMASWDGMDEHGNPAKNGIYFYRLQSGKTIDTAKMVLVR
jgi:hypothetical protein